MKLSRKTFLHFAAGAGALPILMWSALSAVALDYPTRPVHIIVGFPAGTSSDITARLIAPAAVGATRAAIRRRKSHRRRHQCGCRLSRPRIGGRLLAALGHADQRHQSDAVRRAQLQFYPRHPAGRRHSSRSRGDDGESLGAEPARFRNSLPMPRPIRARSICRRREWAASITSPANSST